MKSPVLLVLIIVMTAHLSAQAPVGDCLGAIPICQEMYEETESPLGSGDMLEINGEFNCMQTEQNTVWYTFTVNQSGDFGFLLTPNDPLDDYDWALFNITNANCEDLYNDPDLIVSCNAAGGSGCLGLTGANGDTFFDNQGFNCGVDPPNTFEGFSPFNALVPVEEGNTYVLVVANWSNSPDGYVIDFGLSSDIGIFDNEDPEIATLQLPEDCADNEIELFFSEFIQCASIDASNFQLNGPGGPYDLTLSSVNCDAGGNFAKEFLLTIDPPLPESGDFSLVLTVDGSTEVLDLCDNPAASATFSFSSDELTVPVDLGPDLTLCEGETVLLDASYPGATYVWQDGSIHDVFEVHEAGVYSVTITSTCGEAVDLVEVFYVDEMPVVSLSNDTILCPGNTLLLDATNPGASYSWQDGSTQPTYLVGASGVYAVTATNACGQAEDATEVLFQDSIIFQIGKDTFLCPGEQLVLDVSSPIADQYQWADGITDPDRIIATEGVYTVTVSNECQELTQSITVLPCESCSVYVPNAFSPNSDGINDTFQPFSNCELSEMNFQVFDRWGGLLFETNSIDTGWDGLARSKKLDAGIYIWVLEYTVLENGQTRSVQLSGDILLIRG